MKGLQIAKENLRSCYRNNGIIAGHKHFDDYWSRDGFYAIWGSLELKDYQVCKAHLITFLDNQKPNGELPLRVGKSWFDIALAAIGIRLKFKDKPRFHQDKGNNKSTDQSSLCVIAAYK